MVIKLSKLAKEIASEKGDFKLFALVLPEDTFAWDLVVAAKWIASDSSETLNYLAEKVQKCLTIEELRSFGSIVMLDHSYFADQVHQNEIPIEIQDTYFYARAVKKAYVFIAPVQDFQLTLA